MMQNFLKRILRRPVLHIAQKVSANPDKDKVFTALSALYQDLQDKPGKKGPVILLDENSKLIIFSDQHKGARDGSDDFTYAEKNYLSALHFYDNQGYMYINLGDCEELWENSLEDIKKHNTSCFDLEKRFLQRNAFIKIFGNHDLYWANDPFAAANLKKIYGQEVNIYEGVLLQLDKDIVNGSILLTHGNQGDTQSDGNWFSKWFVSRIWGPLQNWLEININTPATNDFVKTIHNKIMYQWSASQANLLLVTGHTHQPVFESLTQIERLYRRLAAASENNDSDLVIDLENQILKRKQKGDQLPDFTAYTASYFNTGCCCFSDGDLTGIEIEGDVIRLIKWSYIGMAVSTRCILEEARISAIIRH